MSDINVTLGVASERSVAISNHSTTFTSDVTQITGQYSPAITDITALLTDVRTFMGNYSAFFVRAAAEIVNIDNTLQIVDSNNATTIHG